MALDGGILKDAVAWGGNVSSSVFIVFVNRVLMTTHKFRYGARPPISWVAAGGGAAGRAQQAACAAQLRRRPPAAAALRRSPPCSARVALLQPRTLRCTAVAQLCTLTTAGLPSQLAR